jgi:hypothetical protein
VTIRSKLYTAIAVTVAGLALTSGVGIWSMNRLSDRFDGVQHAADARALALQLKFGVTDFNGWQTAYGYDNGRSRPTFLHSVSSFRVDLRTARGTLTGTREQRLLAAITQAFDQFMRIDDQAFAALKAGDARVVRRLFLGPEIKNFESAAAAAQRLAKLEESRARTEDDRFRRARHDARRYLIAASIFAAVVVAILLATAVDLVRRAERVIEAVDA